MTKEYTGTCYIGVVGGDHESPVCRDSIQQMSLEKRDEMMFIRATKGYEARQIHLNNFMAGKHDFLFLMDHDQIFPPDTLERLRAHKLPYVSGYYMRRRNNPITPVWFHYQAQNRLPLHPWIGDPERGKLHRLGASGWGCLLVHREVIERVKPLLKGEPEIIEDDMDVWPYDLGKIMAALKGLNTLVSSTPPEEIFIPALAAHVQALNNEIKPLRADKEVIIGSDIRFPFFAREAGYTLWGDPDVRCGHMLDYPLTPDDYTGAMASITHENLAGLKKAINNEIERERQIIRDAWQVLK